MKIAVIDDYQNAFRTLESTKKLGGHELIIYTDTEKDSDALADRLKSADVVVLTQQRSPFPRAVIERLPHLKMISQTGRNAGHIDLDACTERGIVVSAGGTGRPGATAELTWGLILASLRHIPEEVGNLKAGRWQSTLGTDISGKTLGIYALGKIGSVVARVGRAFGARVLCWGRDASKQKAQEAGYDFAETRTGFFSEADIVSLHLPLNKQTRGIVTREDLGHMKLSSLLVNTSRAGLIADGALVDALDSGRPGFAAVDVYEQEPVLDASHPLLKLKNVICTPHLGYVTKETYENYYGIVIDQILAFAERKPINVANPEVFQKK